MKILINGIGGPTPRSIAKAIRINFPEAILIGIDSNPRALGYFMKGLVDISYIIPRATEPNYWSKIKELINKESIDLAFVQPEQEVLAWGKYFDDHGEYPCKVLLPPLKHAQLLVDKAQMSDLLKDTRYIPKTVCITPTKPSYDKIETEIGYPCWIRASVGSGGLGSLKLHRREELEAWLFIHKDVKEFTVSEFLIGRHLANQMLYLNGECIKNAGLYCAEYVMAEIAPSKVTGNTSYGLFINEDQLLDFCEEVMKYIQDKTGVQAHGVYSFDLKENNNGELKVTEINIRHMAYTGIMAKVGFDLIGDTINYLQNEIVLPPHGKFIYDKDYIFLRDVDIEPIILLKSDLNKIN